MRLKSYRIVSEKIHGERIRLHFLTDLHGVTYGAENRFLLEIIRKRRPDVILVGGDFFVAGHPETWPAARSLTERLSAEFPVYYAMGNHEQYLTREWNPGLWRPEREQMLADLREHSIFLDNGKALCQVGEDVLEIWGCSPEYACYRKPFPRKMTREHLEELLGGSPDPSRFSILLAHNPYHGDAYFQWGSDLTLSGHYHGGLLRAGENIGLVSPFFRPFPRYCCGRFDRGPRTMIVSAGLGEHTVTLRIRNPRELIEIDLAGNS